MKIKMLIALLIYLFLPNYGLKSDVVPDGLTRYVAISSDDKYIILSFYKDGVSSIYMADINGSNVRRLTYPTAQSHFVLDCSSDGSKILFLSCDNKKGESSNNIFVMNADGTNIRQITYNQSDITEAIFSKDGKKIYFVRANSYKHYSPLAKSKLHDFDIYSINIDGSDLKRLTNLEEYQMSGLSLSSDGKKLLYGTMDESIPFHFLSLDNLEEITSFGPKGEFNTDVFYEPILSPNNDYIAFYASRPKYRFELYLMDIKTKRAKPITQLGKLACEFHFLHQRNGIFFMQAINWPTSSPKYKLMRVNEDGSDLKEVKIEILK